MVYENIQKTRMSVKIVKSIENINEMFDEIILWANDTYYLTFANFDFINLKILYLKNFSELISHSPESIFFYKKITFDVMEFQNGIYIFSLNRFFHYTPRSYCGLKFLEILEGNCFKTIIYFDVKYKSSKTPLKWLELVDKQLPKEKLENFFVNPAKNINKNFIAELAKSALTIPVKIPGNLVNAAFTQQLLCTFFSLEHSVDVINLPFLTRALLKQLNDEIPYFLVYYNQLLHNKKKVPIKTILKLMKGNQLIE